MNNRLTRRDFLGSLSTGLTGVALAGLMQRQARAAAPPPFAPKARRVLQLFMNGGASQCDLFDYKPKLIARHGQKFDPGTGQRVEASISTPGAIMKSPFEWAQHGHVAGGLVVRCRTWRGTLMRWHSSWRCNPPPTFTVQ